MHTSCLFKNTKTLRNLDFTTNCPKRRAGNPCKYCYVEAARATKCYAKRVHEYLPYRDEIKGLSNKAIADLNACGGLRLFSFGDYMPEHDQDIIQALDDALFVGLKVKVITKQPEFIKKYHDHPAIVMIHISVDNVGCGVEWKTAKRLRKRYHKVLIRAAIMREEDFKALSFVDIYTLNHAKGLKKHGFFTWIPHRGGHRKAMSMHPEIIGKMCCGTGRCLSCVLKCGLTNN